MYGQVAQSIFRCELCNKPFDKQSTLKRHGYYCRSRKAGRIARSRSCISCARGKARCDNTRPECSRCHAKGIECHYPAPNTPKDFGPDPGQVIRHGDNNAPNEAGQEIASLWIAADSPTVLQNHHKARNDSAVALENNALVVSDPGLETLGLEYLDLDVLQHVDFTDFLNSQTNEGIFQYSSPGSSSSPSLADQTVQMRQQATPSPGPPVSIPSLPSRTPRLLVQRPKPKTGSQRVYSLILHTLKSYLRMMLDHNSLPPFIHPRSLSFDAENSNHMSPLTNCVNLVRMISSEVKGSRKLFWENVVQECERMCEDHMRFNKWELLGAMQALAIYILIRLDEGETDHNNFDFLLLAAVTMVAKQLSETDITGDVQGGLEVSWTDWLLEESRRRLAVIYRVVNMLVYFEPAARCNLPPDLLLAPLPAPKQLWEAGDEIAWKSEIDRAPSSYSTAFALAASGELLKLHDDERLHGGSHMELVEGRAKEVGTASSSAPNWEEWCSGMDELGGLVMLAASAVG